MRRPLIEIPEAVLTRIENERPEREAGIPSYYQRFENYFDRQTRAFNFERADADRMFQEQQVSPDLGTARQDADTRTFDSHEWGVQRNRKEIQHYVEWQREQREQMRQHDLRHDPDHPATARDNHLYQDREERRDTLEQQMNGYFQEFQDWRSAERFALIERHEYSRVAAIDERHGTDDLSYLRTNTQDAGSRAQEPPRPADRLSEWLAREAPRQPGREEPAIERDEPTISR